MSGMLNQNIDQKFGNNIYAHAQYRFIQQRPIEQLSATSGGLKLQCIAIATFSSFFLFIHYVEFYLKNTEFITLY